MKTPYHKILVIGANGMLGSALVRLAPEDAQVTGVDVPEADITDPANVEGLIERYKPALVINAAAYTNVDGCESNLEIAENVNGYGPGVLARACAGHGVALVHISTDFVFAGDKREPYTEEDAPAPISAYGSTKLHGEESLLADAPDKYWIVRTSWLYGPNGKNFVDTMAGLMASRETLGVVADQTGCPTYTEDLVEAVYALTAAEPGLYQFSNSGATTWHGFAEAVLAELKALGAPVVTQSIKPLTTDEYPRAATPPAYSVMSTAKYTAATGLNPPPWGDALHRYFIQHKKIN